MRKRNVSIFCQITATAAVICLLGCNSPSGKQKITFDQDVKLTAQVVPFEQIIAPNFLTCKQGMLVAISSRTDTVFHAYNTPTLDYRYGDSRRGRGPNEVPSYAMCCDSPNSNYLYVRGIGSLASIRKVDLSAPDSMTFVAEYEIGKADEFNCAHFINDSLLVYLSIDQMKIKKYDVINHRDLGEIEFEKEPHGESFFYSNRGLMACTDSLIIYAYIFKKQIDIYDLNTLELVDRLDDGEKYVAPSPASGFDQIAMQSLDLYAGKDYFYVLTGDPNSSVAFENSKMEVYDYRGTPIVRYAFDLGLGLFAVDEEHGFIYGRNTQMEGCWLRYKLPVSSGTSK